MPRKKIKKGDKYYDDETELAVIQMIQETDHVKRSKLWNELLKRPFNTLVEAVINTYNKRRTDISFSEQHAHVLGELFLKFQGFDYKLGYKSFSYFGTIARNEAMNDKKKADERSKRVLDLDLYLPEVLTREDQMYEIDNPNIDKELFFTDLIEELKVEVAKDDLTDVEFKIGTAIIYMFENWKEIFDLDENNKNSNNFNKNNALRILRDLTYLDTKAIRKSIKRFKVFYDFVKPTLIEKQYENEFNDSVSDVEEENPYIDNDYL